MKPHTILIGLLLSAVLLTGCVTSTKKVDPVTGATNTVTQVDPRIQQYSDTAHQAIQQGAVLVPTAAPYFTLADGVLSGLTAIALAISGALARSRNKQAAAADSLAESIQAHGPTAVTTALKTASTNNVIDAVAVHLDNNVRTPPIG